MHEIKSFKIFQTAKVIAVLYVVFGFVEGAILTVVFAHHPHPHPLVGILLSLIGFPILFGVVGFIFLAISCWLYNIVAARIGGIAFDLAPRSEN
jgi:hypothetical protein